jgi:hypothetical protein
MFKLPKLIRTLERLAEADDEARTRSGGPA